MRNNKKSRIVILPNFLRFSDETVVSKVNCFFSLKFMQNHFLLYNGLHFISTRVRIPFSDYLAKSFVISKPSFDSIPLKFRRIMQKKSIKNKKK